MVLDYDNVSYRIIIVLSTAVFLKCWKYVVEGGNTIVRMGDIITKVWNFVISECRYKTGIAQVPVWCRW